MKRIKIVFNTRKTIHLIPTVLSQSVVANLKGKMALVFRVMKTYLLLYVQGNEDIRLTSSVLSGIIQQINKVKSGFALTGELGTVFIKQYTFLLTLVSFKQQVAQPYLYIYNALSQGVKIQSSVKQYIINQFNSLFDGVKLVSTLQMPKINQFSVILTSVKLKTHQIKFVIAQINSFRSSAKLQNSVQKTTVRIFRHTISRLGLTTTVSGKYNFYNSLNRKVNLVSYVAKGRIVRRRKLNEWTGTFATWTDKSLDDIYYI